MTGCGGGLSGGLWAHFAAELVTGADLVLDAIGFDGFLAGASLVVTGEGRIDAQTREGKLVQAIARRCSAAGVRCVAVAGRVEVDLAERHHLGLARVFEAGTVDDLRLTGRRIGQELATGVLFDEPTGCGHNLA